KFGAAGLRGVNNVNYPFDVDRMNIDVDETAKLIRLVKPKVAAFGQSVFLFPTPLRELHDAFQDAGCRVWYDGAHVMGLIAAGTRRPWPRRSTNVGSRSWRRSTDSRRAMRSPWTWPRSAAARRSRRTWRRRTSSRTRTSSPGTPRP